MTLISMARLKELAASLGVDQVGVTTAKPLVYMEERLQRRIEEGRTSPFEEISPKKRLSPVNLLNRCRSIITLALPYAAPPPPNPPPAAAEGPRGLVARCARSIDYHALIEDRAARIVEKIKKETAVQFNSRILSDRSPLLERELAKNSGLGIIGENCTLINPRYGSYVALGTILLDEEIEAAEAAAGSCRGCGRCRDACPTGALVEPFIINPYLCLSYLTQASGVFPVELRPYLGERVYGCDLCQEVCPLNENIEPSPLPETAFSFFPAEPPLLPLLKMTQKEFAATIDLTSAGWRGKSTLQRNTVIALGNSKEQSVLQPLASLLENDRRPMIRRHAAWALGRIGGEKALFALEKSRHNDPDSEVRREANMAAGE